jgi:hypothetical protein
MDRRLLAWRHDELEGFIEFTPAENHSLEKNPFYGNAYRRKRFGPKRF